jgi:ABC-type dipeptide/oligopeptide/nickel transport system permease component
MTRYIINRVLEAIPILIGISIITFGLMHWLPGDPVASMLAENATSEEAIEKLRKQMGLDDPAPVQYVRFILNVLRGDLGRSIITRRPVSQEILTYLPNTFQLAFVAMVLATIFGISMGVLAAINHNGWIDQLVMLISLIGVSMPIFWSGLLLILIFSVTLEWLPVLSTGQGIKGLILPAISLAFSPAAFIARLTRGSLLDIMPQDYIRTARSKGLSGYLVLFRHAMRNAIISIVTIVGIETGSLLTGMIVTETVFTRPGIGSLMMDGILYRDYNIVQGAVLYTAMVYLLVNLLVDISYVVIDPRIRYGE